MTQYAMELYFCPCGGEAMKQVITDMPPLAVGGIPCPRCGKVLGEAHFDEAYACDETGRITE